MPFQKGVFPDLLATSGDYLRVWRAGESETRLECLLNNVSQQLLTPWRMGQVSVFQQENCEHSTKPTYAKQILNSNPIPFQNKNSDFCAPLTSFDWNEIDPNLLGTSSIDTTCTIWGLEVSYLCCVLRTSVSFTTAQMYDCSAESFAWRKDNVTASFPDWAGVGTSEPRSRSREDPVDRARQGGVRHRLQPRRRRPRHVCQRR